MRAQCHVGAPSGAQRIGLPAEFLSPRTASKGLRNTGDLAGATRKRRASITAPLQLPRAGSGHRHVPLSPPCSSFPPLSSSRPLGRHRRGSNRSSLQLVDFCLSRPIHEEGAEMADLQTDNTVSVYLYIPNIVGYMRVLMNFVAFTLCFTNKKLFVVLYFISFACDGLDGWLAHKLNQVSTFGAALDMVTDRVSTACLLVILSQIYSPGLIFLSLLALDIASHWLQMYSTFLSGKASHKDVKDSAHWLLKAYYKNRLIMGFCCAGSEIIYIALFLLAEKQPESIVTVIVNIMKRRSLFLAPFLFALVGWAIKQAVNVLQMKTAADFCVSYDMKRS